MPIPDRERVLLNALWRGEGCHRLVDGTMTSIRRRPVPSAGATYPVQTHLVVGTTASTLPPGRYVYDHEEHTLLRRDDAWERAAGWSSGSSANPGVTGTHLVLTVQPGRSFGRYRHRAWPLWIADTAYALAAVEFLITAQRAMVQLGPSAQLRGLLSVPSAGAHNQWLERGLVPEIPLAALDLPASWTLIPERRDALAVRRSPAISEFHSAARRRAHDEQSERVAKASGQAWVLGAHRLKTWSVATDAPAVELTQVLWQAHRAAAGLCYAGVLTGQWRCRPVSGISAIGGRWIVHALAMLPADHNVEKGAAS